jgi:hypothetical protein
VPRSPKPRELPIAKEDEEAERRDRSAGVELLERLGCDALVDRQSCSPHARFFGGLNDSEVKTEIVFCACEGLA